MSLIPYEKTRYSVISVRSTIPIIPVVNYSKILSNNSNTYAVQDLIHNRYLIKVE